MKLNEDTDRGTLDFHFDGQKVRVIKRDGEPWFVAADVCRAVGITNSRNVMARLDEDEKGVQKTDTLGGAQNVAIVSESGLYALILRSNGATTPGTVQHRFRKWVTSEVLPAIRKDGAYVSGEELLKTGDMTEDEFILRAVSILQKKVDRLSEDNKALSYEWDYVTVAEFVATNHVYMSRLDRARLALTATSNARAGGIELKKSARVIKTKNGPLNSAVNVYPRAILDKAAAELGLLKARRAGDAE